MNSSGSRSFARVSTTPSSHLTIPRTFFGRSEIAHTSFANSDLSESTLCWNDFVDVDFTNACLAGADLRASNYERVRFAVPTSAAPICGAHPSKDVRSSAPDGGREARASCVRRRLALRRAGSRGRVARRGRRTATRRMKNVERRKLQRAHPLDVRRCAREGGQCTPRDVARSLSERARPTKAEFGTVAIRLEGPTRHHLR